MKTVFVPLAVLLAAFAPGSVLSQVQSCPAKAEIQICPAGWVINGGYCFKYVNQKVSWTDADAACKAYSSSEGTGGLAAIVDSQMNEFLYNLHLQYNPSWPGHVCTIYSSILF